MNAIFLDRDGVIIRKAPEGEYVAHTGEVEYLPGALDAIAALSQFGYKIIIVTNQRGIATGKLQLSNVLDIHDSIRTAVLGHAGRITEIYYCPHDTGEHCECRKPRPGMLLQAAQENHLQLSRSWMIGDAASDIQAGIAAGCRTALITQDESFRAWAQKPDVGVGSLASAAEIILGDPGDRV